MRNRRRWLSPGRVDAAQVKGGRLIGISWTWRRTAFYLQRPLLLEQAPCTPERFEENRRA